MKYYKIYDDVRVPRFMTRGSDCFDLCAYLGGEIGMWTPQGHLLDAVKSKDGLVMNMGCMYKIGTGLIFDVPLGYVLEVYIRPSVCGKQGILLANSVGIVDSDYTDELFVLLYATRPTILEINQRIVQCKLVPSYRNEYELVHTTDVITPKLDRKGGFGSTGK